VVSSSCRGLLGRVLLGDDTRAALNGAPCAIAIAIAPAGYSSQPVAMREIGVGYDGSPESEHAVAIARRIACACTAKLSAFEAVSLSTYALLSVGAPVDDMVDLLVVGSRGYGALGRLIHGSTSLQLAAPVRCPLLVLSRAARQATTTNAAERHRERRTAQG
jgi:hypothetical protein